MWRAASADGEYCAPPRDADGADKPNAQAAAAAGDTNTLPPPRAAHAVNCLLAANMRVELAGVADSKLRLSCGAAEWTGAGMARKAAPEGFGQVRQTLLDANAAHCRGSHRGGACELIGRGLAGSRAGRWGSCGGRGAVRGGVCAGRWLPLA